MKRIKIVVSVITTIGVIIGLVFAWRDIVINNSNFQITFIVDGNVVERQGVTRMINEFPEVKKEGYVFEGWYFDKEFSSEFTSDSIINDDVIVYAKFSRIS